ncbi:uncharacterized protein KGF55_000003 [Candida pseudojiufengensis]|uniref:uncharacterized protein n=1 Tax=Candida pseudojiufengensis TaxID=497109 RepID=UPI0022257AF9|nr:uncharacterized protein KGF55_000003 [Candida pseudojiufengensis]KAI5968174.1 hypothetical protein KGF55_000003 [Candida pseudojiufengensis]
MDLDFKDVKSVSLNAKLDDEIVKLTKGYTTDKIVCWLLKMAVYGLKQSGYMWYGTINQVFIELGFQECEKNSGIYFKCSEKSKRYVEFYVDHLLCTFIININFLTIHERSIRSSRN